MAGATWTFSTRADGDFRVDGEPGALRRRRQDLCPGTWTWLRQVHGPRVVGVGGLGDGAGEEADAAVTAVPGAVLAIHTADCAPVLMADQRAGVIGAVHAGWRGLLDGALDAALDAMSALGATDVVAVVGPHIRARCYEFGPADLARLEERFGDDVRSATAWGTPALDLLAAIRVALDGRAEVLSEPGCTACEPDRYYSHRARGDRGRHAAAITLAS